MTERRFAILNDWIEKKPWDFFMFVEIGTDRLHHGFWKFFDPKHRGYEPGNRFEGVIQKYYGGSRHHARAPAQKVDQALTNIYVVSDHGAKRMDGGVRLRSGLFRKGISPSNPILTGLRRSTGSRSIGRTRRCGPRVDTIHAFS